MHRDQAVMTRPQHRSLKHEYELYVDREIEAYKESVTRTVLLGIGDEAVRALMAHEQFTLTELLVWEEVDRIIMRRLGLPNYKAWCRRRLRRLAKYRRPEHWGFASDEPIVRALPSSREAHVLVTGDRSECSALYLAAHGCEVTTLAPEEDALERVMAAAVDAGISGRLHGYVADLGSYAPPRAHLTAVVCTPTAFGGLTDEERWRAIAVLQSATRDGGVHLVETIVAGQAALSVDELAERYAGWQVSVERGAGRAEVFLARKHLA